MRRWLGLVRGSALLAALALGTLMISGTPFQKATAPQF